MSVFFVEGTTSESRGGITYVNTEDKRLKGLQIVADRKDFDFEEIQNQIEKTIPEHHSLYGFGCHGEKFFRVFVPTNSRRGYASLAGMVAGPSYESPPDVGMAVFTLANNIRKGYCDITTDIFCPEVWHGKFEGEEEKILDQIEESVGVISALKKFKEQPTPLELVSRTWIEKSMLDGGTKDGGEFSKWELLGPSNEVILSIDASEFTEAKAIEKILSESSLMIQREEQVLNELRTAVTNYKQEVKEVPDHKIFVVRKDPKFHGVLKEKMFKEWIDGKYIDTHWKGEVLYF